MEQKQNIYLLTNFSTYLVSFSPIIVCREQCKMLKRNGYNPVLIACDGWEVPPDDYFAGVETRLMMPAALHGPDERAEDIEDLVNLIETQLNDILEENAVVLTHDLIFLPDYTVYNLASRRLAPQRPDIHWIHWIHSATDPAVISKERGMYGERYAEAMSVPFPNSIIAYPNAYDKKRVVHSFNFEEDQIVEVPHSTDPIDGMHPIVQRLYNEKRLGEPEVLVIYPLRLDRGKCAEANVKYMGGCKRIGLTSHLVFCDFQSTGDDKLVYREDLKRMAADLGVADRVTFLSEFDDAAHMEVPHDLILDLFSLSNVFLMPSKSETYSLVTQEAMMRGNLCIMNHDFAPFRQIFGEAAIYRQFEGANISMSGDHGEITTKRDTPANDLIYYEALAKELGYWLENDKVLKAKTWVRTQRNPDYVFKTYIEPMIKVLQNDRSQV